jgi:secondary thiamine-phosphate synthase enzyme
MLKSFEVKTSKRNEMVEITGKVKEILKESKVKSGVLVVYNPHTTAGILINENADPDVMNDMNNAFEELVPDVNFAHLEGNSDSHFKSIIVGKEKTLIIDDNELVLGTWDGIFFAEFDGPRSRKVFVKIISD